MKKILLLGTKDKSDLAMYLGMILAKNGLSTLLVDTTSKKRYLQAYTRFEYDDELHFYDFFDVDIAATKSWNELESVTHKSNEELQKYDFILVDIEEEAIVSHWNDFDYRYYVGNHEKLTLIEDADLITRFLDEHAAEKEFNKIVFSLESDVDEEYLEQMIDGEIKWSLDDFEIPYDEFDLRNKVNMQYNMQPTFKKLSKDYKDTLASIVTAISGYHRKDTKQAMKQLERGDFI